MYRHALPALFLATVLFGCAHTKPIDTNAALGRVVVYRNGVAYFERHAKVSGSVLVLNVPNERIDDLLKSLRVLDAKTGKAFPVSYETGRIIGAQTQMLIQLPGEGPHEVRLAYVTESPAWKPSYRLELDEGGDSQLEAWAVVDNVSGEDWNNVMIGVGSTSALSFKYDLHSVRVVERETIADGQQLGAAPPPGGSAYAVADRELNVMGDLDLTEVDALASNVREDLGDDAGADAAARIAVAGSTATTSRDFTAKKSKSRGTRSRPGKRNAAAADMPAATSIPSAGHAQAAAQAPGRIGALATALKNSSRRVKIEGYARPGEADAKDASLRRANTVRDELVRNGVSEAQIDVVATGRIQSGSGVRVLEASQAQKPSQAGVTADGAPIGDAYFVSEAPMTLRRDQSAMVSLLSAKVDAKSVYYYDPISERGSERYAFRAVRLNNPTKDTLDAGPFTVYSKGKFLGEGIAEPIMPGTAAFLPYALDRTLVVERGQGTREHIEKLVAIERGVFRTESRRIRKTTFKLANRDREDARVFLRHAVADGWKLLPSEHEVEKLRGAYLVEVTVPAGESVEVELEEKTPIQKTVDIRTDAGATAIATYLEASKLPGHLREEIDAILAARRDMANAQQRIVTVNKQMVALRQRVDEIHVQLVTLRKLNNARALQKHLQQRMAQISDKLQAATIEVTDLQSTVLTRQIEMQDKVAELALAPAKPTPKKTGEKSKVAKNGR